MPLRDRISISLPASPVTIQSHDRSHDRSHDKNQPSLNPIKSATTINAVVVTPAPSRQKPIPESDITPMPDYKTMPTPNLKVCMCKVSLEYVCLFVCLAVKDECSKFGVRALPKKKMIAKLTEIYDYTHPIIGKRCATTIQFMIETSSLYTDDDGNIVTVDSDTAPDRKNQKDAPSKVG